MRGGSGTGGTRRARWGIRAGVAGSVAALCTLAGLAAVASEPDDQSRQPAPRAGELVVNGGFEAGIDGWRVNRPQSTGLERVAAGRTGHAAALFARTSGTIVLNDAKNTVNSTVAGAVHQVSAHLRAERPGLMAQVRVREVASGALVAQGSRTLRVGSDWQPVTFDYTTRRAGSSLDLNVLAWNVPAGAGIEVDDVSMRLADQVPTVAPSAARPTRPSVPDRPEVGVDSVVHNGRTIQKCLSARGIPSCGAFMGAAIGGNADPAAREAKYGKLALRRTYFQGRQVDKAVRTAKADLAADRLPWISFKPPMSWADMASGKGDAWARDLATRLAALDGPVWVAIHHEPENDGNIADWKKMQARMAPIIRNTAPNVAYSLITTGWNQVHGKNPAFTMEAMWPGDGVVDIFAFDCYNLYGEVKNGVTNRKMDDLSLYYETLKTFADRHDVAWAVAETGFSDAAAQVNPRWVDEAYQQLTEMGGVGFAYFDSPLNSITNWEITTPVKVSAMKAALADTIRLAP